MSVQYEKMTGEKGPDDAQLPRGTLIEQGITVTDLKSEG